MTHSYDGGDAVYEAHEQNHNLRSSEEVSFITKGILIIYDHDHDLEEGFSKIPHSLSLSCILYAS